MARRRSALVTASASGITKSRRFRWRFLERAIRAGRREGAAPSEDPEFVLLHVDGLESMGFCIHYKMPHYVTFQSSLNQLRARQEDYRAKTPGAKGKEVAG